MPMNAFIVRPFGRKSFHVKPGMATERLEAAKDLARLVPPTDGEPRSLSVDFDAVQARLIGPALAQIGVRGNTTAADIAAGNIREDMFNRLLTADLVLADVSIHNPNVFYELGIRQAFRDRHTFLLRSNLSDYPFDLQTDRYFDYDLADLAKSPERQVARLVDALRATLSSSQPDSPVFRLLPSLQSEDRGRFIAVPDEFREEVERARSRRQREVLSVLADECAGTLWEVEGLRVVGRAQFESNFIDGARQTWEAIVNRYPDDLEANTSLSTVYQRQNEPTRSQQALARVSRIKTLTPGRQSELRALEGRNLKSAWIAAWNCDDGRSAARCDDEQARQALQAQTVRRQRAALLSPLLQLACDAYLDAFKLDLNNSYAGLNALTMLVIQSELALLHPEDWESIQRCAGDGQRTGEGQRETIHLLTASLRLAIEADRERLGRNNQVDPWFNMLEAAAMCLISSKPRYVERLFERAVHFAPVNAGESLRRSLELYQALGIRGSNGTDQRLGVGTIEDNVRAALNALSKEHVARRGESTARRILVFVGLRIDGAGGDAATVDLGGAAQPAGSVFPAALEDEVTRAVRTAIREELDAIDDGGGRLALVIAAGANGGDIIFHEQLREELDERTRPRPGAERPERGDRHEPHERVPERPPVRLCLALPRAAYIGQYVASAGGRWVERFATVYRHVAPQPRQDDDRTLRQNRSVQVFADAQDLPRWLHTHRHYNVGRRNNLWMLHHALSQAYELGDDTQITLLAMVPAQRDTARDAVLSGPAMGGVQDILRRAAAQGVKVVPIQVRPQAPPTLRGVEKQAA